MNKKLLGAAILSGLVLSACGVAPNTPSSTKVTPGLTSQDATVGGSRFKILTEEEICIPCETFQTQTLGGFKNPEGNQDFDLALVTFPLSLGYTVIDNQAEAEAYLAQT